MQHLKQQTPALPVNGAGNSHHTQALQWTHHLPKLPWSLHLLPVCTEANMSAKCPFELKWTFWILVSLESGIRGRKCPAFLVEKTGWPFLNWPVLCPFWLWWDRLPGRHLSLLETSFYKTAEYFHRHSTSGARSRDQALPGRTLILVGLTCGNWGRHHVLIWNYPEPCARSLSKWDTGS